MRSVWRHFSPLPPSVNLPTYKNVRFHISYITIENRVERVHFLERIARPYVDKKLSLSDINKHSSMR